MILLAWIGNHILDHGRIIGKQKINFFLIFKLKNVISYIIFPSNDYFFELFEEGIHIVATDKRTLFSSSLCFWHIPDFLLFYILFSSV